MFEYVFVYMVFFLTRYSFVSKIVEEGMEERG